MLNLRRFIENKENKKGSKFTGEQILGTNTAANKFASFWEANHVEMDIVYAAMLHKYTVDNSFDKAELESFKLGLASYQMFFEICCQERAIREAEEMKTQAPH